MNNPWTHVLFRCDIQQISKYGLEIIGNFEFKESIIMIRKIFVQGFSIHIDVTRTYVQNYLWSIQSISKKLDLEKIIFKQNIRYIMGCSDSKYGT